MIDGVDAVQGALHGLAVADVADLKFHIWSEIRRTCGAWPVHLRREVIQRANFIAML